MNFILPERLSCTVPQKAGVCVEYAQTELIRLLKKLGTKVSVSGRNKGLLFTLGDAGKITAQSLKNVNQFVSAKMIHEIVIGTSNLTAAQLRQSIPPLWADQDKLYSR